MIIAEQVCIDGLQRYHDSAARDLILTNTHIRGVFLKRIERCSKVITDALSCNRHVTEGYYCSTALSKSASGLGLFDA